MIYRPALPRRSATIKAALQLTDEPVAADLTLFERSAGHTDLIAGVLVCRHFEGDESLARIKSDASAGRQVRRTLPDDDTPLQFVPARDTGRHE